MNFKNILLSCVSCVVLTGCYTQLSMFYPEPEMEQEEQFYETYSRAVPIPTNLSIYAQDGAGTPLSMAYTIMYDRFYRMYNYFGNQYGSGYYNKYDYYNRYGYHAGYKGYDTYLIGGYRMYIPVTQGERKPRTFSTDRGNNSPGTNLNTTRTRTESSTNGSTYNGGYSNNSNISSTRSSSSSSTSANSSGGTRATRRN